MKNYWSVEMELYRARAQPTKTGMEQVKIEIMLSIENGNKVETEVRVIDVYSLPRNLLCTKR